VIADFSCPFTARVSRTEETAMIKHNPTPDRQKPPTMTELIRKAGDAHQWWGMIAAFLMDSYRVQTAIGWIAQASAWGQVYRKGTTAIAEVVPYDGYLVVFTPFTAAAIKRATAHPELLDLAAHEALDDYLSGRTSMPRILVVSEADTDAVMRLVSLAHPRKGHPCGSL